ncbi:hypothetical protein Bandiella_00705 [Candidatus Bandiella woodruffii]|uniref:Uncharacterized protein n=1 Tax=Candidatus Bandiella euplotis TaxID=1664265 RepID=A0ABZ0UNB9_9RICK|nr:hypothetical protein Bandiella_00705 [Candidatus Bandiella woodruffii]
MTTLSSISEHLLKRLVLRFNLASISLKEELKLSTKQVSDFVCRCI